MNTRELLLGAAALIRRDADTVDDDPEFVERFMVPIAEWLERESDRRLHLGGLDSGYEQPSIWDDRVMSQDWVAAEPSVRLATFLHENEQQRITTIAEQERIAFLAGQQ